MPKSKKNEKKKATESKKNEKKRLTNHAEEKVEKAREKKQDNVKPSERPANQILPYVWFVLSIFLLVCFIFRDAGLSGDRNILGPVGEGIHIFFYGLFGVSSYLIPIGFILLGIFWRKLVDRYAVTSKVVLLTVIIILSAAVFQVFVTSDSNFPSGLWDKGNKLYGGGIIGGTIGWLLYLGLNKVGSIIVIAAVLFVLVMFVFDMTPHNLAVIIRAKHKLRAERKAVAEAERLAEIENARSESLSPLTSYVSSQPKKEPEPKKPEPEDISSNENDLFDDGFFDNIQPEKNAVIIEPVEEEPIPEGEVPPEEAPAE